MKKQYNAPQTAIENIELQQMVCTSGKFSKVGTDLTVNPSNTEGVFEDNTINARKSFSIWNEEE